MLTNYHTHTTRCGHASCADREYVETALEAGYQELGFADHCPWRFAVGDYRGPRMLWNQLEDYCATVNALKKEFEGRITVHLGLEAEYFPCYMDQYREMQDAGVKYFILGNHFLETEVGNPYAFEPCKKDDGVKRYGELVAEGIRTGLFAYVAHPDMYMGPRNEDFSKACIDAADMICQAAKEQNIPLEYNLHGLSETVRRNNFRGYPSPAFWEYARKWDNEVILGTDAHHINELVDWEVRQMALDHLKRLNYRVVDRIHIPE